MPPLCTSYTHTLAQAVCSCVSCQAMSLTQCPSGLLQVEPPISTDGGVDIAMLMKRAANMSGISSCTVNAVLSQLSSPFYLDLKSSTSTAFRLWHLLNTLAQDSVMPKAFYRRMHNGQYLDAAPYFMYNIEILAPIATKVLSVEMSRVPVAYTKKDSQLLSQLRNAEAALTTMKGDGPDLEEIRAEIASLSNSSKLTMTRGDPFRDQIKDYQDRLALLDRPRDDVELLIQQYRSEHKSVAKSVAIFSIPPIDQIYVPVTWVAKYVPELISSTVVG